MTVRLESGDKAPSFSLPLVQWGKRLSGRPTGKEGRAVFLS